MDGLQTNDYRDYAALPGATFRVLFTVVPLDVTGCTATFTLKAFNADGSDQTYSMVLSVSQQGVNTVSQFELTCSAATTTPWIPGVYKYQILCTFPNGDVLPYGTGRVLVE